MLDKLEKIIAKYESLREESLSPEVFQNPEKSKAVNKELSSLEDTYNIAIAYKKAAILYMARGDNEDAIEYFEDYMNMDIPDEEKENIKKIIDRIKNK
jgi:protein subunit release factor A